MTLFPPKQSILCIENDEATCQLATYVFQDIGFEVVSCATPEEGIRFARTNSYAAIIAGFYLDGMDGTDLCRIIRTFDTATPIIFFTGEARTDKKQAAMEAGAQAYLIKPADFDQLEQIVTGLINERVKGDNG